MPLDFKDQYFGCEIELTGINRATAAQTLANLFGTRAEHSGGGYDAYRVKDLDGKNGKSSGTQAFTRKDMCAPLLRASIKLS